MPIQHLIEKAIFEVKQMEFFYDDEKRIVEPHLIGILGGELQLHAYQVSGGSISGHIPEWRNFRVAHIKNAKILDKTFTPEKTYHPENAHYSEIYQHITRRS